MQIKAVTRYYTSKFEVARSRMGQLLYEVFGGPLPDGNQGGDPRRFVGEDHEVRRALQRKAQDRGA